MTPYALAGLLTGISSAAFGLFVFFRNPKRKLYRSWLLFSLFVAGYGFGVLWIGTAKTPEMAYWAWKMAFLFGPIWIPTLFLRFVHDFCERPRDAVLTASYFLSAFFSLAAPTPYFFAGVRPAFDSFYYAVPDFHLFGVFVVWWFGLVIYAHYVLVQAYRQSSRPKQQQIKYFFLAIIIGFAGGSLAYLPFFGVELYPWGTFTIPLYPIIMYYAIAAHQLMDVNLAIRKALLSSVIIGLISWGLVFVGLVGQWLASRTGIVHPSLVALLGGIGAFFIGNYVWQKSREIDRLKYEFITVAAHKLRAPLTHITWEIDKLAEPQPLSLEKLRTTSEKIRTSANILIGLTNTLLEAAEGATADPQKFYKFKNLDLRELAERLVAEYRPYLEHKRLSVRLHSEPSPPRVNADEEKLSVVIQVFLENAAIYSPEGGEIDIAIETYDMDFIIFRVHDRGIGIVKDDLPYVFERLFRAKNAYRVDTEGTGIGLYIAKSIVDRHRGLIGADSEGEGKGSTFWFILTKAR